MAGILLDNDVAYGIANPLRALGHDVVTASELGKANASDDELCLIAAQQARLMITHSFVHFALLHDAWQRWFRAYGVQPMPTHAGILIIPQPEYRRRFCLPNHAAREIDVFLARGLPFANRFYR